LPIVETSWPEPATVLHAERIEPAPVAISIAKNKRAAQDLDAFLIAASRNYWWKQPRKRSGSSAVPAVMSIIP
jgi:hypothetical protein